MADLKVKIDNGITQKAIQDKEGNDIVETYTPITSLNKYLLIDNKYLYTSIIKHVVNQTAPNTNNGTWLFNFTMLSTSHSYKIGIYIHLYSKNGASSKNYKEFYIINNGNSIFETINKNIQDASMSPNINVNHMLNENIVNTTINVTTNYSINACYIDYFVTQLS